MKTESGRNPVGIQGFCPMVLFVFYFLHFPVIRIMSGMDRVTGTGDGRLLALLRIDRPDGEGVARDFSPTMLTAARERFRDDNHVQVMEHNLDEPLPELGRFDAIVSSFAIHHCTDERKRALYCEIHDALTPGGVFCNLEHVTPGSPGLHARFLDAGM